MRFGRFLFIELVGPRAEYVGLKGVLVWVCAWAGGTCRPWEGRRSGRKRGRFRGRDTKWWELVG